MRSATRKKRINLEDRLVSYKVFEYVMESFLAKVLLLIANFGLSFWMTGYQNIFDIVWILLSTGVFVVAEVFLLLVAAIAEISAEMLCDVIDPRYAYVPPDLYKKYPEEKYRSAKTDSASAEEKKDSSISTDMHPKEQKRDSHSEEQAPAVLDERKPAEIESVSSETLAEDTQKDVMSEEDVLDLLPSAVGWYCKQQQDRGMDVTAIEGRYVWYLSALILRVYGSANCQSEDFIENALKSMPEGYAELAEDVDIDTIYDEYTALTDTLSNMENEFQQMEDPELFEYIYGVELFINTFEHVNDGTRELLCECLEDLLGYVEEDG